MKHMRSFTVLVLTCAAVLAIGPQAFASGVQLLANPGFEENPEFTGWFTFGNGVQRSTPSGDNIARTDTAAAKIFGEFNGCPIPNFDVGGFGQAFPLPTAGRTYDFSGYAFVSNSDTIPGDDTCIGNRCIAKIVFFDAASGGNEITSNEVIVGDWSTPRQTWIPFSVSALVPPGALRVEALILFLQPGCDEGAVFVDDLFLGERLTPAFPNVLANPSFDTDLSGWTTFGNVFYEEGSPLAIPSRASLRRTPTGAAKLFGTFVDGNDSGMFQKFDTEPGTEWRLSVYALNTCFEDAIRGTNENVALARIVFRDNGGADIGGADVIIGDNSSPLGTWTRYEVSATAPALTDSVDAFILFTQGVFLEDGAIFVDDVEFTDDVVTGIDDTPSARGAKLRQNVPNPFNPSTRISFDLAQRENVSISVYDVKGRLVNTLYSGQLGAGPHSVEWDGTSAEGTRVSSGVYLYVLQTSTETIARRMVLLK
jgi:hypothetical protein